MGAVIEPDVANSNAEPRKLDELGRRWWFASRDPATWPMKLANVEAAELESDGGVPLRTYYAARRAAETSAIKQIAQWADLDWMSHDDGTTTRILVLSGPTGVGKSTAAAWWALYRKDFPDEYSRWLTGVELGRLAQSRDDDPLASLLKCMYLVVDDLGAEHSTAARIALVDELVDRVHRGDGNAVELVITTNLKPKQFASRYGARVVDRLSESGTWISVRGESLRRRKARDVDAA